MNRIWLKFWFLHHTFFGNQTQKIGLGEQCTPKKWNQRDIDGQNLNLYVFYCMHPEEKFEYFAKKSLVNWCLKLVNTIQSPILKFTEVDMIHVSM
jgi:hypothetical protein